MSLDITFKMLEHLVFLVNILINTNLYTLHKVLSKSISGLPIL